MCSLPSVAEVFRAHFRRRDATKLFAPSVYFRSGRIPSQLADVSDEDAEIVFGWQLDIRRYCATRRERRRTRANMDDDYDTVTPLAAASASDNVECEAGEDAKQKGIPKKATPKKNLKSMSLTPGKHRSPRHHRHTGHADPDTCRKRQSSLPLDDELKGEFRDVEHIVT